MAWWKILLIGLLVIVLGGLGVAWYVMNFVELDMYVPMYTENCGGCHGNQMQGTDRGIALLGAPLARGDSVDELQVSIRQAHFDLGNPAFAGVLTDIQVKGLAIYIGERRLGQHFTDFRFDRDVEIPVGLQSSEQHSFKIKTVAQGLDPMVFSIEPLPDGSMVLTEKERGLSIVSADGVQSELIVGTPEMGSSIDVMGIQYGSGWLLDVATHPQYEDNGWIYLHYTHICGDECGTSMLSATMNRLDRGRIKDGQWVDVQTIWQSPVEYYSPTPDTGAGGRIAFDDAGYVYISLGIKSADGGNDTTPQDLHLPYGKILRLHDDGTVPLDNPYFVSAQEGGSATSAVTPAIWSYGHRSPQGLEWHPERGTVWDSEMGPRGGDELNELLPGRNYGWPYVSGGLEYSGYVVARHKPKAIEFDGDSTEYSLVDITPSPAISSFVFYTGNQFPSWKNNVLIGSLKGSSLFRMEFDGRELVHQETLIKDLARIRDVEVGYDGLVYLLLENEAGSSIVKLTPG